MGPRIRRRWRPAHRSGPSGDCLVAVSGLLRPSLPVACCLAFFLAAFRSAARFFAAFLSEARFLAAISSSGLSFVAGFVAAGFFRCTFPFARLISRGRLRGRALLPGDPPGGRLRRSRSSLTADFGAVSTSSRASALRPSSELASCRLFGFRALSGRCPAGLRSASSGRARFVPEPAGDCSSPASVARVVVSAVALRSGGHRSRGHRSLRRSGVRWNRATPLSGCLGRHNRLHNWPRCGPHGRPSPDRPGPDDGHADAPRVPRQLRSRPQATSASRTGPSGSAARLPAQRRIEAGSRLGGTAAGCPSEARAARGAKASTRASRSTCRRSR